MDEEYYEPASLPYNKKSFGMIIIARKGDGMCQLAKFITFNSLTKRFNYELELI